MIPFVCSNPKCGRRFKATAQQAQRKLDCPKCGAALKDATPPALETCSLRDLIDGATVALPSPTAATGIVEFACEQCHAVSRARAGKVGQTVICPKCTRATTVTPQSDGQRGRTPKPPEAEAQAQREAEAQARREAEEQAGREAARHAALAILAGQVKQLVAIQEAERQTALAVVAGQINQFIAIREAEERARRKAEAKRRAAVEVVAGQINQVIMLREAEERARREAAEKARRQAEEKARREAAEKARRQAEEKARREAEEKARRDAKERVRREAKEKAQREAEERARREAAEKARREAEERVRCEAERQARRDALRERFQSARSLPSPDTPQFREELAGELAGCRRTFNAWLDSSSETRKSAFRNHEEQAQRRWRLERLALGLDSITNHAPTTTARNRLGGGLAEFLLEPVAIGLGGRQVSTAVGLSNPFRLASQPATATQQVITKSLRSLANGHSTGRESPLGLAIGLDGILTNKRIRQTMNADVIHDGKSRLLAEVFWFHLSGEEFDTLRDLGDTTCDSAMAYLRDLTEVADPRRAAIGRHGLAVAWLNTSIAREMAFATGRTSTAFGYWDVALEHWIENVEDDVFWKYFAERTATCSLAPVYAEEIREQLLLFLTGLVGRFARAYGQRGESVACHRLITVLQQSSLPERLKQDAACAVVQSSFY